VNLIGVYWQLATDEHFKASLERFTSIGRSRITGKRQVIALAP
jgi:hypothetical protein